MSTQPHLLVVDDDDEIRELLQTFLTKHQFQVSVAPDGKVMREQLDKYAIDLVIMDLMLPEEDGLQLCKFIQNSKNPIPVIMLTALGDEVDRIIGLEVGADDYLPKPFNPRELLARIKAVLRRVRVTAEANNEIQAEETWMHFANWRLSVESRTLHNDVARRTISLSSGEFDLLIVLLKHPRQVLSRDQLMTMTRGIEASPLDRSIDIQISRLRKKLEETDIIKTIRNGGYQLDVTVTRTRK